MGCQNSKDLPDVAIPSSPNSFNGKSIRYLTGKLKTKKLPNQNMEDISLMNENVMQIERRMSGEDLMLVKKAISSHFLFYTLTEEQRLGLIEQMKHYQSSENSFVFQKGDQGTTFFVITEGIIEINIDGKSTKTLEKGESFGELALIYSSPRSSSAISKTKCTFWGLDFVAFRRFVTQINEQNFKFMKSYIQNFPIFDYLNDKEKDKLIFNSHRFKFKAGSTIFRRKDPSNSIFIVVEGRVQMKIPNKPRIEYLKKQIFGEGCLTGDEFRSGTAVCSEDTECLAISKETLLKELDFQTEHILFYCICKWSLKRSNIFTLFKKAVIDKIIESGQYLLYENGEIIEKSDTCNETVYICLEGKINDEGVGSIFNDNPFEYGGKDLIKRGKGFVFSVSYCNLGYVLKQPFRKIVEGKERVMKTLKKTQKPTLNDYVIIQKLQQTDLGEILLVKDLRSRKKIQTIEIFSKKQVIKNDEEEEIHMYLQTLKNLRAHHLIPSIQTFFSQDPDFLFVVRGAISFISLQDLIEDHNLDQQSCKYYLACMIEILDHLHNQNIVHRNVRPENFFLNPQGQLCSFDLSSMKKINSTSTGGRTFTVIGTPHYMAPETMEAKGYSFPADVWALGITMYEICFGLLPFAAHLDDPIEIYKEIKRGQVIFPHHYKNTAGINLIKSILHPNESMRETLDSLREMEYFKDFNMEKILDDGGKVPPIVLKGKKIGSMALMEGEGEKQLLTEYIEKKKLAIAEENKSKKCPNWDRFL